MNWSGAKNWLIFLFVAINIFLIFTIIKSNMQSSVIEEQTIGRTIDIMRKNDITVDPKLIPTKMPKLGSIDVQNIVTDFDEFALRIFGDMPVEIYDNYYSSGTKRLSLTGDMIFYTDSNPSDNISDLNASTSQRYALNWLREHGFETDMLHSNAYENRNGYIVRVEQKIDKYALLDSQLEIFVTKNGITELSGSWFIPTSEQGIFSNDATRVKSITSILLDFARDNIRIKQGSNVIVQIDLGYTTGDKNTHHKFATAVPVWRIRCSDNNEYFYEAR